MMIFSDRWMLISENSCKGKKIIIVFFPPSQHKLQLRDIFNSNNIDNLWSNILDSIVELYL